MSKVVVLGAGESGVGAAILAQKKGYEVFLSDNGKIAPKYKDVLYKYEIAFEEEGHVKVQAMQADIVVKSPGIPDTAALVLSFAARGAKVISEIEWAAKFCSSKLIGITGSNGKTTTTSLIFHLLQSAGLNVGLAGNIGKSFAWQVAENHFDTYVLELSSFQLDGMFESKIDVAVLLNISPDHLDRYQYQLQNYINAKMRITQNATSDSVLVLGADDHQLEANFNSSNYAGTVLKFGLSKGKEAKLVNGKIQTIKGFEIPVDDLPIKGKHNVLNAMAAILVGEQQGLTHEQLVKGLISFSPIEHRLEPAGEINGVKFINDSKATNIDAVFYALDAMKQPVIWIVGGVDKGNDYTALDELVKQKVKAIVCLGKDNTKLLSHYKGMPIKEAKSAKEAVEIGLEMGEKGDVVLLSPACASFDLFKNYEDRGKQFKQAIINLSIINN